MSRPDTTAQRDKCDLRSSWYRICTLGISHEADPTVLRSPRITAVAGWLLLASLIAAPASAVVIYDTFGFGDGRPDRLVGMSPVLPGDNFQYADPFLVQGGDFELETIQLQLQDNPTDPIAPEAYLIHLRADSPDQLPGAVLETWSVPGNFSGRLDLVLPSEGGVPLRDGEIYWVNVAISGNAGSGAWLVANVTSPFFVTANTNALNPTWTAPPEAQLLALMTITATVPEPATLLLLATGLAALAWRVRRG